MRSTRFLLPSSIAAFLALPIVCNAQGVNNANNTGLPSNGLFNGTDVEIVEINNGNLHIDIPIWSEKGRGLDTYAHFVYDNKGWTYTTNCVTQPDGSQICTDTVKRASVNHMILSSVNSFSYGISFKTVVQTCHGVRYTTYNNIMLVDPSGTPHHLNPDPVASGAQVCWPILGGTLAADDASGWLVYTNSSGFASAANKHGVTVSFSSAQLEDTNGNQVLSTTDTLGRAEGSTSYYDSSGTQQNFVVVTESIPVHTNLCAAVKADSGSQYCNEYVSSGWTVPQKITLPDGLSYTFTYASNAGAEITSIALPTGAQISYTYGTGDEGGRMVSSRTVLVNGVSSVWTYTPLGAMPFYSGMVVTDPALNDTQYTCLVDPNLPSDPGPCYFSSVKSFQGSYTSGTLLLTKTTDWSSYLIGGGTGNFARQWVPIRETTTWNQQNLVKKTETDWDTAAIPLASGTKTITWQNPIERREYDWGTGTFGPLRRRTDYNYLHLQNSTYLNKNIADRVTSIIVYDGSSNTLAQTTISYDGSSLTPTSGAPNHDYTNFGSSNLVRGNPTTISRWVNTSNSWLNTTNAYDDLGNVLTTTDPAQHTTTFSYTDNWANSSCVPSGVQTHGYVTQMTNALNQNTQTSYFPCTGLVASLKDQNDINASRSGITYSYDSLARVTSVNYPDSGQTTNCYTDVGGATCTQSGPPFQVVTTRLASPSPNQTTTTVYDGLGRPIEKLTSDPDCSTGEDRTDTTYDAVGRLYQVSNPYCTTSDPTYGLTTYAYDALNRTTQITQPNNSTILTNYTGRATQVRDEGNGAQRVTRISQSDALGRLTSVCEVSSASLIGSGGTPVACGQDIAGTGFLTTYQYDALDNLLQVNQSGIAPRTFTYDSLSRLLSASNPESGTVSYTYDADGNVHTKTDARNIATTYTYDASNRLTGKTYSDGTPSATFNYDQASALGVTLTNTIGRKSSESTGGSLPTGSVFSYDPMERVANNSQCTPQNCGTGVFAIQYTQYDLLGNLISGTNATGVTFTYTYNGAARLTAISSNFVDASHPGTLLSQATYNAPGLLKTVLLGNGLTETRNYNSRLWLTSLSAGTVYSFNMTSYAPNGDVLAANDSVNGNWTYSYDPFNRVVGSNQNSGHAVYSYVYDRFGNRWQQNGPYSLQLTFTGNNPPNPQNNNRMDGYTYDAAGNLLNDGSHQYFYDAENRLIQVDGTLGNCSAATACYVYDAQGRRVRKTTASGTLDLLYDAEGHKVAEVDPTGTFLRGELFAAGRHFAVFAPDPGPTGATFFIHADWLGTERARTNMSGTACETITSLPFGDGQTISDSCGDSAGDVSPLHFTGKERDSESGLDNLGARYMGSSLGRFTTPDPLLSSGHLGNPQTWNRYAYGLNNPLRIVDPTGLYDWDESAGGNMSDEDLQAIAGDKHNKRHKWAQQALNFRDQFRNALDSADEAAGNSALSDDQQSAAQAAVNAYGSEGDNNGVTVGRQDGHGASTLLNNDDTISVKFGSSVKGDFLTATVAHEGAHVDQAQTWLRGGESSIGDLNHYAREQAAWNLGSSIAQALGMKNLRPYGGGSEYEVWNKGWKAADVQTLRSKGVANILNYSSLKPTDTDTYSNEHHQ